MYRYLIIESKQEKQMDDDIISLLSDFITYSSLERNGYQIIMTYEHEVELSFEDVILNMMSDTLTDLRMYVSQTFTSMKERDEHLSFTQQLLINIPFSKYHFLDNRRLIHHFLCQLTEDMKKHFLMKYYQDTMMIETLKCYLDANLNTVHAAKKLYVHRNTLIQRLDKFIVITGLDVKVFQDALLIYHLIN